MGVRIELPLIKDNTEKYLRGLLNCHPAGDLSHLIAVPFIRPSDESFSTYADEIVVSRPSDAAPILIEETRHHFTQLETVRMSTTNFTGFSHINPESALILTSRGVCFNKLYIDPRLEQIAENEYVVVQYNEKLGDFPKSERAYFRCDFPSFTNPPQNVRFLLMVEFGWSRKFLLCRLQLVKQAKVCCRLAAVPPMAEMPSSQWLAGLTWSTHIHMGGEMFAIRVHRTMRLGIPINIVTIRCTSQEMSATNLRIMRIPRSPNLWSWKKSEILSLVTKAWRYILLFFKPLFSFPVHFFSLGIGMMIAPKMSFLQELSPVFDHLWRAFAAVYLCAAFFQPLSNDGLDFYRKWLIISGCLLSYLLI
jgi:hypothetical protein